MANAEKWYYAYTINGDTITIEDACHEQNMYEDPTDSIHPERINKKKQ